MSDDSDNADDQFEAVRENPLVAIAQAQQGAALTEPQIKALNILGGGSPGVNVPRDDFKMLLIALHQTTDIRAIPEFNELFKKWIEDGD